MRSRPISWNSRRAPKRAVDRFREFCDFAHGGDVGGDIQDIGNAQQQNDTLKRDQASRSVENALYTIRGSCWPL